MRLWYTASGYYSLWPCFLFDRERERERKKPETKSTGAQNMKKELAHKWQARTELNTRSRIIHVNDYTLAYIVFMFIGPCVSVDGPWNEHKEERRQVHILNVQNLFCVTDFDIVFGYTDLIRKADFQCPAQSRTVVGRKTRCQSQRNRNDQFAGIIYVAFIYRMGRIAMMDTVWHSFFFSLCRHIHITNSHTTFASTHTHTRTICNGIVEWLCPYFFLMCRLCIFFFQWKPNRCVCIRPHSNANIQIERRRRASRRLETTNRN